MRPVDRAYLASSLALNALLCLIGAAMVVSTLARGGGVLALGVVLGVSFVGLGAARLWLVRGAGARREP
jgi:type IV secretory pathway TrbL component